MNLKNKSVKVAVCSRTFYKNLYLRNELKKLKKIIKFNKTNKTLRNKELSDFIGDSEITIIGLEIINKSIINKLPNLKTIIKYGVGLDKIDLNYLKKKNIKLIHFPGFNKRSVSELVLGYILAKSRNLYEHFKETKNKNWENKTGNLVTKKKIGIIGCGNIGKDLIKILKPFDNEIYVNDIKNINNYAKKNNLKNSSKKIIFKNCDFISIHIPYNKKNRNIIDQKYISLMRDNSTLINTSRGNVVNENDLYKNLKKKNIFSYFDVLSIEPLNKNNRLINLKNFFLSPHIGGSTLESILEGGRLCIKRI